MALKLNPLSGEFDYVGVPLQNGLTTPILSGNGDIQLAQINGNGRVYFEVGGTAYYFEVVPATLGIKRGQPIGLMGVTYANDI